MVSGTVGDKQLLSERKFNLMPSVLPSGTPGFLSRSSGLALAVEACRHHFKITDAASCEPRDWPNEAEIVNVARRHRVQGLVSSFLGRSLDPLSPQSKLLSADAGRIASHALRSASASSALRDAFTAAGVDLLFVKGLALAALAYRDPFIKMSWDTDILVAENDVVSAADVLAHLGYSLISPPFGADRVKLRLWHRGQKESTWANSDGIFVELHSRLADNEKLIPNIGMYSPRQSVCIANGLELVTLAAEPLFAYLCVHGASSAWFRLKWVADLAGLLAPLSGDAIDRLYRSAEGFGAGRAAAQALLVIDRLFTLPLSVDFRRELRATSAHRWLATAALQEIAAPLAPMDRRFGTARIHLTQLLLKPGPRFLVGECARQVRTSVANLASNAQSNKI